MTRLCKYMLQVLWPDVYSNLSSCIHQTRRLKSLDGRSGIRFGVHKGRITYALGRYCFLARSRNL